MIITLLILIVFGIILYGGMIVGRLDSIRMNLRAINHCQNNPGLLDEQRNYNDNR